MKQLPDEQTLKELLSMGKDLEEQARKVYQMSEALAQKYEPKSSDQPQSSSQEIIVPEK
ncbi:MAG: hypothetical protein AAF652_04185 [Cyanobacteria bacterium P01_C01_bin.72]